MKMGRPPGFETMAMDGWIKPGPGEACCLAIDTPTRPSVQELRVKMQGVRRMVLAAGFTVENNLVLVQQADEFGTTDRKQGGSVFAEKEDYLRAETTGVGRRLEGAKAIVRRILGEQKETPSSKTSRNTAGCVICVRIVLPSAARPHHTGEYSEILPGSLSSGRINPLVLLPDFL